MAELKRVAKDTAIYGLSSIIGRFLNYLLVPLYTAKMTVESGGYGVVTNIYAYVALLLVILTFGMETTLFRFANKRDEDPERVYTTTLTAVGGVALLFAVTVWALLAPVSSLMGYADHPEYVGVMAVTVALDAFQSIPFAWLRHEHRPMRFFALKMLFIGLNITLNILYFAVLPALYARAPQAIGMIYDPEMGPGYAFILNLVCTSLVTLFFIPDLCKLHYCFDAKLLRRMLHYSWPILVLGIAGILNQTADKIIFPLVYGDAEVGKQELGVYGACVKIAMIMAMITQAFRYAYEPFVFGKAKDKNSKETYAVVMKYFVIFTLLAYLCVMGYLDVLKYIIAPSYWPGLRVVPIVMAAEIMMGIYFNLSFWYKLIDKTIWGAWFSLAGCAVLFAVNIVFIPRCGYMACAWGGFAGYATAMLLSYFVGQRKNAVDYPLKSIGTYVLLACVLYAVMALVPRTYSLWLRLTVNTVLVAVFATYVLRKDLPPQSLPVIGKYFSKNEREYGKGE